MTQIPLIRPAVLLAGLAFAVSCGSADITSADASLDLTTAISQTSLGDMNSFAGATAIIGVPGTSGAPAIDPSRCVYTATDQSFVCPVKTVGGLTFKTSYFLYDAAGHALSQVNPAATASVRTVIDVTGAITLPTDVPASSATIDHHSDMTLSGLLGATRALNGTSRDHDILTTGSSRTVVDLTGTTANVVLPSGASKWPASGTITSVATTATTVGSLPSVTTTANAVLTFNGTNVATLVATVSGRVTTCQIDLSGAASPRCSS